MHSPYDGTDFHGPNSKSLKAITYFPAFLPQQLLRLQCIVWECLLCMVVEVTVIQRISNLYVWCVQMDRPDDTDTLLWLICDNFEKQINNESNVFSFRGKWSIFIGPFFTPPPIKLYLKWCYITATNNELISMLLIKVVLASIL